MRPELVLRIWECTAGQIAKEVDAGILGNVRRQTEQATTIHKASGLLQGIYVYKVIIVI